MNSMRRHMSIVHIIVVSSAENEVSIDGDHGKQLVEYIDVQLQISLVTRGCEVRAFFSIRLMTIRSKPSLPAYSSSSSPGGVKSALRLKSRRVRIHGRCRCCERPYKVARCPLFVAP
jgi:hypothetical protein